MRPETAVAIGMMFAPQADLECPTCERPAVMGKFHYRCLQERCGGKVPDDMERLIEAFKLMEDGDGSPDTTTERETRTR